jgi:hypothetical protein
MESSATFVLQPIPALIVAVRGRIATIVTTTFAAGSVVSQQQQAMDITQ